MEVLDSDVECPIVVAASEVDPRSNKSVVTEQNIALTGVRAYPNPFDQFLVIEFNGLKDQSSAEILISDVIGRIKLKSTIDVHPGINRLTVSTGEEFAAGIYYVSVKNNEGHVTTTKVVRMRK